MFSFINHAREIFEVSKANGVDTGVAYDMFRTDVARGANNNCGPVLEGFDFAAVKNEWDELTIEQQYDARDEWRAFAGRAFKDLQEAFAAGDRDAFDEAVEAHRTPEAAE